MVFAFPPQGLCVHSQHICSVSDHPGVVTGNERHQGFLRGKSSQKLIQVNQKIGIINSRIKVLIQILFPNFCRQSCCIVWQIPMAELRVDELL